MPEMFCCFSIASRHKGTLQCPQRLLDADSSSPPKLEQKETKTPILHVALWLHINKAHEQFREWICIIYCDETLNLLQRVCIVYPKTSTGRVNFQCCAIAVGEYCTSFKGSLMTTFPKGSLVVYQSINIYCAHIYQHIDSAIFHWKYNPSSARGSPVLYLPLQSLHEPW